MPNISLSLCPNFVEPSPLLLHLQRAFCKRNQCLEFPNKESLQCSVTLWLTQEFKGLSDALDLSHFMGNRTLHHWRPLSHYCLIGLRVLAISGKVHQLPLPLITCEPPIHFTPISNSVLNSGAWGHPPVLKFLTFDMSPLGRHRPASAIQRSLVPWSVLFLRQQIHHRDTIFDSKVHLE